MEAVQPRRPTHIRLTPPTLASPDRAPFPAEPSPSAGSPWASVASATPGAAVPVPWTSGHSIAEANRDRGSPEPRDIGPIPRSGSYLQGEAPTGESCPPGGLGWDGAPAV